MILTINGIPHAISAWSNDKSIVVVFILIITAHRAIKTIIELNNGLIVIIPNNFLTTCAEFETGRRHNKTIKRNFFIGDAHLFPTLDFSLVTKI